MRLLILLLLVLFLLLQYRLWVAPGGLPDVWRLQRELAAREAENRRLEARNRALEAEVRDLKEGLEAVEERARSEMGMIREGEIFYQIIDRPPEAKEKHD